MPKIDTDKCIACGMCIENCPHDAIQIIKTSNDKSYSRCTIDENMCFGCLECLNVDCPSDAIGE